MDLFLDYILVVSEPEVYIFHTSLTCVSTVGDVRPDATRLVGKWTQIRPQIRPHASVSFVLDL